MRSTTALTLAATASSALALSSGCTMGVGGLALNTQCLQITKLLPIASGSGSVIDGLNGYMESLCADSTPVCTNETLTKAQQTVTESCSDAGDASIAAVLMSVLQNYEEVRTAACSKNTTTNAFCVTETLQTVQNSSGTDITLSFATQVLTGDSSAMESLSNAFGVGDLCNGCVSTIYGQALKANSTLGDSTVGQAVKDKCGADFGTTAAQGVSLPSAGNASTTGTGGAASTSGSSGSGAASRWSVSSVLVAGASVGSVIAGAALVL